MKSVLLFLLVLVGLYVALVGALYAAQRRLIYPADLAPAPPALGSFAGFEEVTYRTEDGLALRALYRPAAPGKTTLLYFHGNADGLSGAVEATRYLADQGYGAFLVEYRGYGGNPGQPTEAGLYADGTGAIEWLAGRGVPNTDLIIVGTSLGSGPATEMAVRYDVAALVIISGYTSLPDVAAEPYFFVPVHRLMLDRYENQEKIGRVRAPVLVLHGSEDRTIPVQHAVKLERAAGEGGQLVVFDGIGHELAYTPIASPAIERWILATLGSHSIQQAEPAQ